MQLKLNDSVVLVASDRWQIELVYLQHPRLSRRVFDSSFIWCFVKVTLVNFPNFFNNHEGNVPI